MAAFPPSSAIKAFDQLGHRAGQVSGPGIILLDGVEIACECLVAPYSFLTEQGETKTVQELECWPGKDQVRQAPPQGRVITYNGRKFEITEIEGGEDDLAVAWHFKALATPR